MTRGRETPPLFAGAEPRCRCGAALSEGERTCRECKRQRARERAVERNPRWREREEA